MRVVRSALIGVRCLRAEVEALDRLAAFERVPTRSEALRMAIREAARERGLWPPERGRPYGGEQKGGSGDE
ncbi:MAG: ribbon-helix-helix protein, CopG family [Anaerolineales bacterium]|nr:ribbon-helix-helix protein, CopG family [Anaerolineales bacterium]